MKIFRARVEFFLINTAVFIRKCCDVVTSTNKVQYTPQITPQVNISDISWDTYIDNTTHFVQLKEWQEKQ